MSAPLLPAPAQLSIDDDDLGVVRARAEYLRDHLIRHLNSHPQDSDSYHTLGVVLYVLKSHESANNSLARAIMIDGSEPWTWYWMARNCLAMDDPAAGLMAVSRALELAPDNAEFAAFNAELIRLAGKAQVT
jgi:cytochrome c-type biogenesis protein CcmH/NrfG